MKPAMPVFLVFLSINALLPAAVASTENEVRLPSEMATLVEEARHLRATYADEVWSGWAAADIPIVLVSGEWEFALGFPRQLDGWQQLTAQKAGPADIQFRTRTFPENIAAAFPVDGVPSVVIGDMENTGTTPARWVYYSR